MIDIKELRRLAQAAIAKMNASDPEFASSTPPLAILELLDRLEAAEKERDDLKAKIAEMEKQDPVTWHVWGKVAVGSMAAYSIPLYALPGAKGE